MKTIGKVAAAIAIAALHWCVTAATIEVATVAELTNAVARANAGEKIGGEAIDTIRLMKSGSPYRFTDEKMDSSNNYLLSVNNVALTIEGEDSSPRQTWTDGDEPVIIDGNSLGCIIRFASGSKNKEIRNLCFTGGRRNDGGAVRGLFARGGPVPRHWPPAAPGANVARPTASWRGRAGGRCPGSSGRRP